MNDSKNSSKGLLVLKLKGAATADLIDSLLEVITPTAEALGVEPLVLPAGVDVDLRMGSSALLERVCAALEEIAAQGRAPEVSEAQIAPQALNDRPSGDHLIGQAWTLDKGEKVSAGLNSRPEVTCRDSWQLGTACGKCSRCEATRPLVDPSLLPRP